MRKLLIAAVFAASVQLLIAAAVQAQTGNIRGKVIDSQTHETLPGATLFIRNTSYGAAANANGTYEIRDVPPGKYTLTARYVGYQDKGQIVEVREGVTLIANFALTPSGLTTSPVVVTAIGTRQSHVSMGTQVSTVSGQSLVLSGSNNIAAGLRGTAPGVYVSQSSGDPGSATRIVLRGARSLQNNNEPLIVIDGEPVFSNTVGNLNLNNSAGSTIGANNVGGTSAMSVLDLIDPSDIASMNVYEGPSAAAIWGSRAANGVLVITTKGGSFTPGRRVNISIRNSVQYNSLLRQFPLQTSYGEGVNGDWYYQSSQFPSIAGIFSWGDKISLRSGAADVHLNNNPFLPIVDKNSTQTYNQAGALFQPAVSDEYGATISGGDQDGTFYLDVDRLGDNGIFKANSLFNRTSILADIRRAFSQNVTFDVNASYVNGATERVQQGSNLSGILLDSYRTPPDFNNLPYLVNYVSPTTGVETPNVQRTFRNPTANPANGGGYNNPFFTMYEDPTTISLNELLGSVGISYDPTNWLDFTYRAGVDYEGDRDNTILSYYDVNQPQGQLIRNWNNNYQVNTDLQGRASHDFSRDFTGNLLLGFHLDQIQLNNSGIIGTTFINPNGPPSITNDATFVPGDVKQIIRDAAAYGELNLNLYRQLYVNFAGRDESSSTYGPNVPSLFFYPAVNAAWEFTKLPMFKNNSILNFGKIRAAYGEAADQPPVYSTLTYYTLNPIVGNGWGPAIGLQYYYNSSTGIGGALIGAPITNDPISGLGTEGNPSLGPEKTTEFEYGFDIGLFHNWLQLSATGYHDLTSNAILGVNVAPSSGFTNIEENAAKVSNVGYELQATINWLRIGSFSWQTIGNWSTNHNDVYSMPAGVTNIFLSGFTDPYSAAVLGQQLGVLWGSRWARNTNGSIKVDANGFPVMSSTFGIIGDPNPNYLANIFNTFRFGRFTLGFQFSFKIGGMVWNGTEGALAYFGRDAFQSWSTTIDSAQANTLKDYAGYTVAQMVNQGDVGDWGTRAKMVSSGAYRKNANGTYTFRGYVHNFGGGPVIVDETYYYDGPGSGFTGPSEAYVQNGSYIELSQLSLGYTFPMTSLGFQSLNVTLIGRNLALWTKYTGIDPGVNLTGPTNGQGIDYFNNPTVRTWILSLSLNY